MKYVDETLLSIDNLSKVFNQKNSIPCAALKNISFEISRASLCALVGPDGAGKSTLLRILAGLLSPTSGNIYYNEKNFNSKQKNDLCLDVAYMPQKFGLYEDLSVEENFELYADLKNVAKEDRKNRFEKLLSLSGLTEFKQRLAGNLSGGMKQKLGLICTLVAPPKLLLLDEPTVGVDPLSRRELWDIIIELQNDIDMSVIISTAYMDEAEKCDSVLLLFEGECLAQGSPKKITKLSENMAFFAQSKEINPRILQEKLLSSQCVIDALPQCGGVRFLHNNLSEKQNLKLANILKLCRVEKTPSSLEDSFMLLLKKTKVELELIEENIPLTYSNIIENSNEVVIETQNVVRLFGNFIAVNDVSFSVNRGEVFGLLGPNGAGKTTTFRMLCGLLEPSSGTLKVAGIDVKKSREEARSHIGYVAQKFSLYGILSVKENLEFFAGAYGLVGKHKKSRIFDMIDEFQLEKYLNHSADLLPGGYKQRLALAVGLIHEPKILFLDEATSGADPLARREFWQRITKLAANGVTIVITTHFMEEAEYCDRILIQDHGNMLALGTPEEIRRGESIHTSSKNMEQAFIRIVENSRRVERRHYD